MVIVGVQVPVLGITAIVLSAFSIYAFVTAFDLRCIVHGMDESRKSLIKLVTENPVLVDRPSPTDLNSITADRLIGMLQKKSSILETTPDDFYIINKSKELEKALKTLHEYFARALDQFNPRDVEAINSGVGNQVVIDKISSFFDDLNFSVSHLTNFTTIPQLNLPIS